jgi:O-antigen/teichoic acid export membrane protein
MNTGKRIVKNSLVLYLSHLLSKFINLALVIILTRMLGTDGFGIYNFAFAFVILFMVLGNMGLNSLLTRDIARSKSEINRYLGSSIPLIIYLSIFIILVINGITLFIHWSILQKMAIAIFSLYMVFDSLSRHFIAVFRAFEKMEYEALTNFTERLIMLAVTVVMWVSHQGLLPLLWSYVVIQMLKALIAFLFMRRFFQKIEWHWTHPRTFTLLKTAYPFALMAIFGTISGRIDTIMLKIFQTDQMVGLYNAGHKIIESLQFIPENFALALFPAFSVLFFSEKEKFNTAFSRAFQVMTILAFPVATGLYLLAPQIIHLLFEPQFSRATIALRWLSIALGLIFFKFLFSTTLNATGKQHLVAAIIGISTFVNVVLNYILIPKYDLLGASLATIISEFSAVLLIMFTALKLAEMSMRAGIILKTVTATVGMGFFLLFFQTWNVIVLALAGGIFYIILIFLLQGITVHEIRTFIRQYRKTGNL